MKQFESVPIRKPAYNVFNLSHDVKSSYNFDYLYPILSHPVYPGETFNCRAEVFLRTMPLLAPVMHNVDMFVYFFFIPWRLVWNEKRKEDWKTFITGGEKGTFGAHGYTDNPSEDFVLPHWNYYQLNSTTQLDGLDGKLLDHLGFPSYTSFTTGTGIPADKTEPICSLPFRAYQLVWNEYFRNQNVQNEIEFSFDSGLETSTDLYQLMQLRRKCFEKDYFTSCLPFQQRGEAVTLPIAYNGDGSVSGDIVLDTSITDIKGLTSSALAELMIDTKSGSGTSAIASVGVRGSDSASYVQGEPVELTGTTSVSASDLVFEGLSIGTITDFRYCLRLQQWLENNARCGSRYIEQILAHFGVTSSDARLQRPELLGGGKIPLIFSDVPQTSATDESDVGGTVQGNLAGKGMLYGKTGGFKKYFEEHGLLLGLVTIIPRTSYSQGIPRYWTAMDKTDWYFPEFAHLSEQAVLNKEIYYNPLTANPADPDKKPDGVFGYQGRFTELRYIPSSVHGEMKGSLQYWHFGRLFSQLPRLNSSFVTARSRVNVFAEEDIAQGTHDPFVAQIHLDIKAVRPLPRFAVPTL